MRIARHRLVLAKRGRVKSNQENTVLDKQRGSLQWGSMRNRIGNR
jgi:hypothetical protein